MILGCVFVEVGEVLHLASIFENRDFSPQTAQNEAAGPYVSIANMQLKGRQRGTFRYR